jgi:hypothetical protein
MARKDFYLPEWHDFEFIAHAPWPLFTDDLQQDWIRSVNTLELWLNRYVGSHHVEWAFHNGTSIDYWQACIAFRRERNRTLFLLTWS